MSESSQQQVNEEYARQFMPPGRRQQPVAPETAPEPETEPSTAESPAPAETMVSDSESPAIYSVEPSPSANGAAP